MTLKQVRKVITTGITSEPVTTAFFTQSCAISQIVISIQNDGTSWTFRMFDYATPAFTLIPTTTVSAPDVEPSYNIHFEDAVYMEGGVKVITTGGTAGEVAVWISAWVNE